MHTLNVVRYSLISVIVVIDEDDLLHFELQGVHFNTYL